MYGEISYWINCFSSLHSLLEEFFKMYAKAWQEEPHGYAMEFTMKTWYFHMFLIWTLHPDLTINTSFETII